LKLRVRHLPSRVPKIAASLFSHTPLRQWPVGAIWRGQLKQFLGKFPR
jgi:hypothetical protein